MMAKKNSRGLFEMADDIVYIPFKEATILTSCIMAGGFILCIVLALVYHFERTTWTHCGVRRMHGGNYILSGILENISGVSIHSIGGHNRFYSFSSSSYKCIFLYICVYMLHLQYLHRMYCDVSR